MQIKVPSITITVSSNHDHVTQICIRLCGNLVFFDRMQIRLDTWSTIENEINIVYNHLLYARNIIFFFLSTLNSTCHLCPRHQISEMLLQRWRSPCNQRFCPKTGEASCPMNGTMKSSSSWIEKISTVVRSHELTSLKVIICAISRWSTHISCHRHIFFPPPPSVSFVHQSLSITRTHTFHFPPPHTLSIIRQVYRVYPGSFS